MAKVLTLLLMPLSWLYGIVTGIRNILFDKGILPSEEFELPVICVGNIAVGGTGKTPHTEYLIRLLSPRYKVAVLSRGYKRKSKGYLLATQETEMEQIGDEPYQMAHKFPDIQVAVDRDRRNGIRQLTSQSSASRPEVILLDDAYQHRYVKPGLTLLLTDYNRLLPYDYILPAGRLRESARGKDRADVIIVTKCPADLDTMQAEDISKALSPAGSQQVFFTTLRYGRLAHVYQDMKRGRTEDISTLQDIYDRGVRVMLVTGIANPRPIEDQLTRHGISYTPLHYADHHDFTMQDVQHIQSMYRQIADSHDGKTIIITTEKDSTRMLHLPFADDVKQATYMLPIEVEFLYNQSLTFNTLIEDYVRKD